MRPKIPLGFDISGFFPLDTFGSLANKKKEGENRDRVGLRNFLYEGLLIQFDKNQIFSSPALDTEIRPGEVMEIARGALTVH